jgi:hypothetical protein
MWRRRARQGWGYGCVTLGMYNGPLCVSARTTCHVCLPTPSSPPPFRTCLSRALDHTPRCPMCRTILHHTTTQLPSTVTLANLLEHSFPQVR